jgi:hypothetical protein
VEDEPAFGATPRLCKDAKAFSTEKQRGTGKRGQSETAVSVSEPSAPREPQPKHSHLLLMQLTGDAFLARVIEGQNLDRISWLLDGQLHLVQFYSIDDVIGLALAMLVLHTESKTTNSKAQMAETRRMSAEAAPRALARKG